MHKTITKGLYTQKFQVVMINGSEIMTSQNIELMAFLHIFLHILKISVKVIKNPVF